MTNPLQPPPLTGFHCLLLQCLALDAQWRDHSTDAGYKLGSYDEASAHITLYAVHNTRANFEKLRAALDAVRVRYRLVLSDPREAYTNVELLDIDV